MVDQKEIYISVDIEAAGPSPGIYSLLSIGACTVQNPQSTFYVELKPANDSKLPSALEVSGLDWDHLVNQGVRPSRAMTDFADWIAEVTPEDSQPVFLAFNAVFDWMFVNEYFYRYLGSNPFGHKALDIKAYFMGMHGVSWEETAMRFVASRYLDSRTLSHNALNDAQDQAEIFRRMLNHNKPHPKGEQV
jgi:DNA polymerase III epsilon subunit-like protein